MRLSLGAIAFALLAFALCVPPQAIAEVTTASQDLDRVWRLQNDARAKVSQGNAEAYRAAQEKFTEALAELDRADVREKAKGNMNLFRWRHDLNFDLATVNARLGDREGMLKGARCHDSGSVGAGDRRRRAEKRRLSHLICRTRN